MTVADIAIQVLINDQAAYCTPEDLAAGRPTVLDGLTFGWGRETIVDQPEPGSASFTVRQQITTTGPAALFDVLHVGAVVKIRSTGGGRDVLAWVGEITAVTVSPVTDGAIQADVTCIDTSALLSNITIGDDPWPQQDAEARFVNILNAAGLKLRELQPDTSSRAGAYVLTGEMDPTLQDRTIAYRDVDTQPPLELLHSLATSVAGVCWLTADPNGPYLWIEDPTQRESLRKFLIDPGTAIVTIEDIAFSVPDNPDLWTASDVVRDPVTWTQDPSQAITVVNVTWLKPGIDEEGLPTSEEQTVTQSDPAGVSRYGVRALDLSTELAVESDANDIAFNWMVWSRSAEWVVAGLSIDTAFLTRPAPNPDITDTHRLSMVMDLLDIRLRIGYRLSIEDLPAWSPVGTGQSYYLEGGSYTWENRRWLFELTGTANAIGGGAIYEEFPASVVWEDFDPSITWIDAYGVAAPDPVP